MPKPSWIRGRLRQFEQCHSQAVDIGRLPERGSKRSIGKTLGKFGEQLQMLLGEVGWHDHGEDQVDRQCVAGIEFHPRLQAQEGCASLGEGQAAAAGEPA